MQPPQILAGLSEAADHYDVLLCDVWGVIHNGREAFPEACAALKRFRETRGPVIMISNSPRLAEGVAVQMRDLGVPDDCWSALVTSGDATRSELAARAPGPVWAVGPVRDAPLYEGLGVVFAETPEEAAFVCCTGLFDDEVETPEDFRSRLQAAAARDLLMVCANPDRVVQRGDRLIYCAGALADLYQALGGRVTMAGKPYAPIYGYAYAEAERLLGRPLDKARILAIGDGAPTDVRGAQEQGLDCLFIASGIHGAESVGPDGQLSASLAAAVLAHEGASARYASLALRW